jgi:bacteriocin-like protein
MTDLNELNLDELNSVTGGVDKPKNPKPPANPGHFEIDDFSFDV